MDFPEMTPRELRSALRRLSWSQLELARRCGINKNTPSEWARRPAEPIPGPVAAYVELSLQVKDLTALLEPARER